VAGVAEAGRSADCGLQRYPAALALAVSLAEDLGIDGGLPAGGVVVEEDVDVVFRVIVSMDELRLSVMVFSWRSSLRSKRTVFFLALDDLD